MRLARRLLMAGIYIVLVALAGGALYQAVVSRIDMRHNPAPGKLVDIGGFKLHINCKGEGEPTVVFDSGMADDSLAWYKVQPQVAKFTRACSYDRAGLGWSEPSPNPRTSATIVKELHTLLRISNIPPPYILVGHSFGGMNVRLYAHSYPGEVAGLILVDSSSPDQFRLLPQSIQAYNASFLRRQGYFQATMLVGWPRISGWCDNWPADVRIQRRTTECRRQPWITHIAEYEGFDKSSREVAKASTLGSLPLIVLSHDTSSAGPVATAWMTMQKNLANLSTRGVLEVVSGGTHNLQEDHPGAVIDATKAEVDEVRRLRNN
jgi:pimeloyl-ACP methyl ester carboxylesterase